MKLKFTKMHGLGNDFMVIDRVNQEFQLTPELIRHLGDRHRGIGFDQLLLVEPAPGSGQLQDVHAEVDFTYRIFNRDGGEVEQCGNGARCFAKFVTDKGLTNKRSITVQTNTGIIGLNQEDDGQITVNMGMPRFEPAEIPFIGELASRYHLDVAGKTRELGIVSIGNPHAVLQVPDVAQAPVAEIGPLLESHPRFPQRVNVGFMQIVDKHTVRLRVFERGVGETQACGTGACAAVVIGKTWELLNDPVDVMLPGGKLIIRWPGEGEPVMMTGPAVSVFEGCISL